MKTILALAVMLLVCSSAEAGNFRFNNQRFRNTGNCNNNIDDVRLQNAILRAQLRNQDNRRFRNNGGFGGGGVNFQFGLINRGR
jgi:hypothetical protein